MEIKVSDTESQSTEVNTETKVSKSIVSSKYGNKYKKGGNDELATFINAECVIDKDFNFSNFFALARVNGVDEAKVAHYEALIASKAHGSQGRARMTIRNLIAGRVRKVGHAFNLNLEQVAVALPELPKPGEKAAAEQPELALENTEQAAAE